MRVTLGVRGRPLLRSYPVLLALLLCFPCMPAQADDPRDAYLIKLLAGSSQFRVRAQAAISLGAVASSPAVQASLTAALSDVHPAVRAAAASSLGRLGDSSSIPALRRLGRDAEQPVRSAASDAIAKLETNKRSYVASARTTTPGISTGPQLYYVSVPEPATRVTTIDRRALSQARAFIKQRVGQMRGVVIAPDSEDTSSAEKVLRRQNLKGFSLDSSIVSVEQKGDGGTRVAVSVILATYPGRNMRAVMQGAATVSGGGGDIYIQALEGALSGALRQLPTALAR